MVEQKVVQHHDIPFLVFHPTYFGSVPRTLFRRYVPPWVTGEEADGARRRNYWAVDECSGSPRSSMEAWTCCMPLHTFDRVLFGTSRLPPGSTRLLRPWTPHLPYIPTMSYAIKETEVLAIPSKHSNRREIALSCHVN
jgi:hypothetical protein